MREVTVAMLRDLGYRALKAANGEETLRAFGAHAAEISLMLLDVAPLARATCPGVIGTREDLARKVAELVGTGRTTVRGDGNVVRERGKGCVSPVNPGERRARH